MLVERLRKTYAASIVEIRNPMATSSAQHATTRERADRGDDAINEGHNARPPRLRVLRQDPDRLPLEVERRGA
jgi:hypothetical protein